MKEQQPNIGFVETQELNKNLENLLCSETRGSHRP